MEYSTNWEVISLKVCPKGQTLQSGQFSWINSEEQEVKGRLECDKCAKMKPELL